MEAVARVLVTVTFLRMDQAPAERAPPIPDGTQVVRVAAPSVPFYRYLYDTVGGPHLWWLRRVVPDSDLATFLVTPGISIHVLYAGGEPAGFYELDARPWPSVNLSYFGLVPHRLGQGLGYPFLRHAVDLVWSHDARAMTVNTCTADHPRALPAYRRAGFRLLRQVREQWDVPLRLGMRIPEGLRAQG
jgi:GNAT superfamily N-acetyltransferase